MVARRRRGGVITSIGQVEPPKEKALTDFLKSKSQTLRRELSDIRGRRATQRNKLAILDKQAKEGVTGVRSTTPVESESERSDSPVSMMEAMTPPAGRGRSRRRRGARRRTRRRH